MWQRFIRFGRLLHREESAIGTIEWFLLITVALMVIVGINYFAQWTAKDVSASQDTSIDAKKEMLSKIDELKKKIDKK